MSRKQGHEDCDSCPECGLTNCPDCDTEGRYCRCWIKTMNRKARKP